jgi:predicted AAA+ superfamily ATPase
MKNIWYNPFKYIRRKIETHLLQNLDRDETMVLVGPRQSGKTTLLKHLKKILEKREDITFFINLEKKQYLYLLNQNPENLVFKLLHDRGDLKNINFWRTQDKNEVDFIIDKKFALEVKYNGIHSPYPVTNSLSRVTQKYPFVLPVLLTPNRTTSLCSTWCRPFSLATGSTKNIVKCPIEIYPFFL